MMTKPYTTLFMAMSVNGMIAEANGSEDFVSHENWNSFLEAAHEHGNFIIGRKTLEAVRAWEGEYGFDELTSLTKVILSQTSDGAEEEQYHFVSSPQTALTLLAEKGYRSALVTGGSVTNRAFLEAGLINLIMLNVEPSFVGSGIPLAAPFGGALQLRLKGLRQLPEGFVQLSYVTG